MHPPLFFLHVPKTAGTSLRIVLETTIGARLRRAYPPFPGNSMRSFLHDVHNGDVIYGHFVWGAHSHFQTRPIYAAVLRHPVERLLSWYRFKRQNPATDPENLATTNSLAEMIYTDHIELNNHMTTMIAGRRPSGPDDLETLGLAKSHLRDFVFVSTDKTLSNDLPRLSSALGVELPPIPFANRSRPENIAGNDRTAAENANKLDIELYNHALLISREATGR